MATRKRRSSKQTRSRSKRPRAERERQDPGANDDAFRYLDPRLARLALSPAGGRELPPRGSGRQALGRAQKGRSTAVTVPSSLAGLPLARLALLAQVSEVSARRFETNDRVSVLLEAEPSQADAVGRLLAGRGIERVKRIAPRLFIARVPRSRLAGLAADEAVRFIEASVRLESRCQQAHLRSDLLAPDGTRRVAETGRGVLVGIVDTGIDAAHPAFWSGRVPRVVHYRDQLTGDVHAQSDVAAGKAKKSPDEEGHGTHVAGIACGNGARTEGGLGAGVAPEADLAVVKTSFSTADIADAVAALFELASQRKQPCVVNLSLGGHGGAHDGSSILERAIDTLCEERGRAVVVSAGNEGASRIHASTTLPSGQPTPARWTADLELKAQLVGGTWHGSAWIEVWSEREDDLRIRLRSPNGELFEPPRESRAEEGREAFAIETSHQVARYSQDNLTSFGIQTIPQARWLGGWSLLIEEDRSTGRHGVQVGTVHGWISGEEMGYFSNGFTRSHLVGMPGTAAAAITVASYASRKEWPSSDPQSPTTSFGAVNVEDVSYFSSTGPTRTGHNKPDVAAPGQWIVSALSGQASSRAIPDRFRAPNAPYAAMQGTSMAAPYVTGAVALLFQRHPSLHWAEIKRRLVASTKQDRYSRPCWNERWGHGKLSIERFLAVDP